jgi:hypothetical protein
MSPPAPCPVRKIGAILLGALLFPLACFGALVLVVVVCQVTGALDDSSDEAWAGLGLTILAVYAIVLVGPVVGGVIGYMRARRTGRRVTAAPPAAAKAPTGPSEPPPPSAPGLPGP